MTTLEQWIPKQLESLTLQVQESPKLVDWQNIAMGVVEPSSEFKSLTHDADLSDLWDYYELEIAQGRMSRDKIAAKECCQRCKRIAFVYPGSVIYRHPRQIGFGLRLMQLGYRYCKDCNILIPKSIILELEQIQEARKERRARRPPRTDATPIKCPCCRMKTAQASVLIRRTKMGQVLFRDEGY